jgi:predicted alpha/beta-fold hydrolase
MAIDHTFAPCPWLANGHLQTWAGSLLPRKQQTTQLEPLHLPDGDCLELHWLDAPSPDAPLLILLHGLEGSVNSSYIQGMLKVAYERKWRMVVPHLRGSGGRINQLPQAYHAGKTEDFDLALQHIRKRFPNVFCAAIGYSLGANVLLKYLGEQPLQSYIRTAIAVSVPFDLKASVLYMNKIYNKMFVKNLKKSTFEKIKRNMLMPIDAAGLVQIKTLYDFDDKVTAPLHGFSNAEDYYQKCSCIHFLPAIQTPTLIIHAKDDPMIPESVIPTKAQVSEQVILDIQEYGGHVGFIACKKFNKIQYWLEERILFYLLDLKKSCNNSVLCAANTPPSIVRE